MFFWSSKSLEKENDARPVQKISIPEEELLKEAWRIGRYAPTNCECPPAPDIKPVWIDNNIQALEVFVQRFYRKYNIPPALEPRIFLNIYEGFKDLVKANPDEKDSPFCMSSAETIIVARHVFIALAKNHGVSLAIDS